MRLLVVEDEQEIMLALFRALSSDYLIDCANTAAGTLKKLATNKYDAIILDLNLPDSSGLGIYEKVRMQGVKTPILVLSESAEIIDQVKLPGSSTYDYLTKPFSIEELKARLRVLLRQPPSSSASRDCLVVGDLMLDCVRHQVERAGKNIDLRKKEFAVLECLMKNAGRVVSRDALTDYAWDEPGYSLTNTVDVHIKYLRDKIDRPFGTELIKTVHGLGYKIEAQAK